MSQVSLNTHITKLKESATLKINQKVREDRANGQDVFHFGFGQSPFPVCKPLVDELKVRAFEKDYLPTFGLMKLREQISKYYKERHKYNFDPEFVVIGPGSKELIFQSLFILEGAVIIPAPSWVSYGPQVEARGKSIHTISCKFENSYKLQKDELEAACVELGEGPKTLIINSPNNPTGAVYSDEEIKGIVEIAKKHSITIISDEIYGEIDWSENNTNQNRFFNLYPEGTLVTGGLSKAHGAGGWRLGFLAGSPQMKPFFKALGALISETFSAVSAPIQYAAIKGYELDSSELRDYFEKCHSVHKVVGTYMGERFNSMGVKCPMPKGAFYLMPDFSNLAKNCFNIIDFTNLIYKETGVAMLPGTDFYLPEDIFCTRVATVDYDGSEILNYLKTKNLFEKNDIEKYCPNIVLGLDRLENFLKI